MKQMKEEGWIGGREEGEKGRGRRKGEQISERRERWKRKDKDRRKEGEGGERGREMCSLSPA